ncbi:hypothetical protein EYZ11_006340 [Aspergillus tanneri]|uniref:Uncharacterized protein n=1 Tax=Aspergillus tanneri TaxID=1220188 RepID=A0A4S3JFS0_9EURO|nr:hypothetical protein EYZ11_006340 [Aspergillus tanneri]
MRIHIEKTLPQLQNRSHDAEEGSSLTVRFSSRVVGLSWFVIYDAVEQHGREKSWSQPLAMDRVDVDDVSTLFDLQLVYFDVRA